MSTHETSHVENYSTGGSPGNPQLTARSEGPRSKAWILAALGCAYLWFRLICNLSNEWMTNPQYSYGLVVPLLCIGLVVRRLEKGPLNVIPTQSEFSPGMVTMLFLSLLAFLYLPTRLVEGATPEWRPIQWMLGVEAIGLTLGTIYLAKGAGRLKSVALPICIFFVAIPWPTLIEQPIIQNLTRISAVIVVELLSVLGIPALQHGNLIEISTGSVGIDEACSGIRSFQTSFMISLFFGEFYRLKPWKRIALVPFGLLLAMLFNICRMCFLTIVASRDGIDAISHYHDPAGVTISIGCTLAMWGATLLLKEKVSGAASTAVGEIPAPAPIGRFIPQPLRLGIFGACLVVWFLAVEGGVQLWYRHLESGFKPQTEWHLDFPKDNPTFTDLPIPETTKGLLRYDEAKQAAWEETDGTHWQGFYAMWLPGRVAGYLAKRHTPDICLPATGRTMRGEPKLLVVKVGDISFPVRQYVFDGPGGVIHVFHCRWEAGVDPETFTVNESARFNLVRGIWAGRGTHGQKVIEVIISGVEDPAVAKDMFLADFQKLVVPETSVH